MIMGFYGRRLIREFSKGNKVIEIPGNCLAIVPVPRKGAILAGLMDFLSSIHANLSAFVCPLRRDKSDIRCNDKLTNPLWQPSSALPRECEIPIQYPSVCGGECD